MSGLVPSSFDVNAKVRLDKMSLLGLGTILFSAIIMWKVAK